LETYYTYEPTTALEHYYTLDNPLDS
jgi:hypothetical protein